MKQAATAKSNRRASLTLSFSAVTSASAKGTLLRPGNHSEQALKRELAAIDAGEFVSICMVEDINPDGNSGYSPTFLSVFNNKLYFSGYDESLGGELWVYDGSYNFFTSMLMMASMVRNCGFMMDLLLQPGWQISIPLAALLQHS